MELDYRDNSFKIEPGPSSLTTSIPGSEFVWNEPLAVDNKKSVATNNNLLPLTVAWHTLSILRPFPRCYGLPISHTFPFLETNSIFNFINSLPKGVAPPGLETPMLNWGEIDRERERELLYTSALLIHPT